MSRVENVLISDEIPEKHLEKEINFKGGIKQKGDIEKLFGEVACRNFNLEWYPSPACVRTWRDTDSDYKICADPFRIEGVYRFQTVSEKDDFVDIALRENDETLRIFMVEVDGELTVRKYLQIVRDFIEEVVREDVDKAGDFYNDWKVIEKPNKACPTVKVPHKGMAIRIVHRAGNFCVEQSPLTQGGNIAGPWTIMGGGAGSRISIFDTRDEAQRVFEEVQKLSDEKLHEKYDFYGL